MSLQTFSTGKEVFMNFANMNTRPALVNDTTAVANSEGRKIIKAGTPLGASKPFYMDPNHVVLTPVTDGTAQAVAMHDIDITEGQASDTVVRRGDAVLGNMDEDVQAKYTDAVQKALVNITLN